MRHVGKRRRGAGKAGRGGGEGCQRDKQLFETTKIYIFIAVHLYNNCCGSAAEGQACVSVYLCIYEIHLTIFQLPAKGITHLASVSPTVSLSLSLFLCVCRPFEPLLPLLLLFLCSFFCVFCATLVFLFIFCFYARKFLHMWHLLLLLLATLCR